MPLDEKLVTCVLLDRRKLSYIGHASQGNVEDHSLDYGEVP